MTMNCGIAESGNCGIERRVLITDSAVLAIFYTTE